MSYELLLAVEKTADLSAQSASSESAAVNVKEQHAEKKRNVSRLWDQDTDPETLFAIDVLSTHLIQTGRAPHIDVTGDIIQVTSSIYDALLKHVPDAMAVHVKAVTDYISLWLCDYTEETGVGIMRVKLGLENGAEKLS